MKPTPLDRYREADNELTKAIQQGASRDTISYLRTRFDAARTAWLQWEAQQAQGEETQT